MQDILKILEELPDSTLEAMITRAEELLRGRARQTLLAADPAIGMWKDRDDMRDSTAWVRLVGTFPHAPGNRAGFLPLSPLRTAREVG